MNDYIKTRSNERPERGGNRWGDKPVGEATINKELRMLRAALNWAASEHKIPRPPNFRIELSSGTARTDWISKEEANKLMGVAPSHLALFLLIALTTAKRREAILSLKWADVALHLPGHESINFGEDVGNKRRGSTPIIGAARLIEALKTAKAVAKTDYVVEFRGRRVMDVKTSMTAACKRAGLRHISAHTLKHSAITWMVQADVPLERIAKFTNTSKEVIEATYGHHSPSFVAEAVNAVAF
ncbi:tyrosine-type recombinase/integrase [Falsiroseomonas sp.]|uniref:tyrosine-type recombinase/integrase n=1 Tax=Falsiroseomonas sp. TaxID=2870721 RepID=UPI00272AA307|nr:tyrosine-type recombinase/integrase [Falsiroseomonas sp.]